MAPSCFFPFTDIILGSFDIPASLIVGVSVLVSLKTSLLTNLKLVKVEKDGFVPSFGQFFIVLSNLFYTVGRVGALVLFFTPSLGLWDTMHHYKNEKIPYRDVSNKGPYNASGTLTTHTGDKIPWKDIGTSDVEGDKLDITEYTGLSLKNLYILLLLGFVVHVVVVFLWKQKTSSKFR